MRIPYVVKDKLILYEYANLVGQEFMEIEVTLNDKGELELLNNAMFYADASMLVAKKEYLIMDDLTVVEYVNGEKLGNVITIHKEEKLSFLYSDLKTFIVCSTQSGTIVMIPITVEYDKSEKINSLLSATCYTNGEKLKDYFFVYEESDVISIDEQ